MLGRGDRLLKAVIKSLDSLQASLNKYVDTIGEQNKTSNRKNEPQPPPAIHATLGLPVEVTEYCKTQSSETRATKVWRWIKNILETAAVITAVLLVILTYRTLRQVKRQADAAQSQ